MKTTWDIDAYQLMLRRHDIERWKYYEGFKYGRDKAMFEEELVELVKRYHTELEQLEDDLEDATERHIRHAQVFIDIQKQKAEIHEKLDTLLAKLGKGGTDE